MSSTVYYAQNSYFLLGTVDLSAAVQSISLTLNYDQLDISAAGDSSHKYLKGLAAHTISGTLYLTQDAASAGATRATLDNLKGTSAAFAIAPNGSTASTTNPKYSGSCFVNGYTPVAGSQGEVAMIDFTFDCTTDVTIATAP
jgi:hypothetical protein